MVYMLYFFFFFSLTVRNGIDNLLVCRWIFLSYLFIKNNKNNFFKKKKKKEKRKNDFMVFVHYLFVATHFGACTGVTAEAIVLPSNHLD
jgi:hypothetical protein